MANKHGSWHLWTHTAPFKTPFYCHRARRNNNSSPTEPVARSSCCAMTIAACGIRASPFYKHHLTLSAGVRTYAAHSYRFLLAQHTDSVVSTSAAVFFC